MCRVSRSASSFVYLPLGSEVKILSGCVSSSRFLAQRLTSSLEEFLEMHRICQAYTTVSFSTAGAGGTAFFLGSGAEADFASAPDLALALALELLLDEAEEYIVHKKCYWYMSLSRVLQFLFL